MAKNNESKVLNVSFDDSAMEYFSAFSLDNWKKMSCPDSSLRLYFDYKLDDSTRRAYKTLVIDSLMPLAEMEVKLTRILNYIAGKGSRSIEIIPIVHVNLYEWNIYNKLVQGICSYLDKYGTDKFDNILVYAYEDWLCNDVSSDEEEVDLPW